MSDFDIEFSLSLSLCLSLSLPPSPSLLLFPAPLPTHISFLSCFSLNFIGDSNGLLHKIFNRMMRHRREKLLTDFIVKIRANRAHEAKTHLTLLFTAIDQSQRRRRHAPRNARGRHALFSDWRRKKHPIELPSCALHAALDLFPLSSSELFV